VVFTVAVVGFFDVFDVFVVCVVAFAVVAAAWPADVSPRLPPHCWSVDSPGCGGAVNTGILRLDTPASSKTPRSRHEKIDTSQAEASRLSADRTEIG